MRDTQETKNASTCFWNFFISSFVRSVFFRRSSNAYRYSAMHFFHCKHCSPGTMQKSMIESIPFITFWVFTLSRHIIPNSHRDWSHGHSHCDGLLAEPSISVQTIWFSLAKNMSKQQPASFVSGKGSLLLALLSPFCTTVVKIFNPVQFSKWRMHGTLLISAMMLVHSSSQAAIASPRSQYWCSMTRACCSDCCWSANNSGTGIPLKIKSYVTFLVYCHFLLIRDIITPYFIVNWVNRFFWIWGRLPWIFIYIQASALSNFSKRPHPLGKNTA